MEIKILQDTKDRLKFEVEGEGHSFCNALRREIWNDDSVNAAGYRLVNTLTSSPIIIVDSSKDPKKVVLNAVERLHKQNKNLIEKFKKALK